MEFLHLLFKANVAFTTIMVFYLMVLRNLDRLRMNRAWLLAAPAAAFVLPVVGLPANVPSSGLADLLLGSVPRSHALGAVDPPGASILFPWAKVYLAGLAVSLLLLAARGVRAWRLSARRGSEALSFFNRIVIPEGLNAEDAQALLRHEQVHVQYRHSLDVLYYELLVAISWWNPMWRVALRELRTVHELQADAVASRFHSDYGSLLVARAMGVPASTLLNSFRSPILKTRILMLNAAPSKHAGMKYAASIPALALAMFLVAPGTVVSPLLAQEPVYDLGKVEVPPEFPGGMEAMYTYLVKHMHYPEKAKQDKVEGKVFVEFIVAQDGTVREVGLRHGIRKDLDDEALRAVRSMPAWSPGKVAGKAVATRFTLPVAFTLAAENGPSGQ